MSEQMPLTAPTPQSRGKERGRQGGREGETAGGKEKKKKSWMRGIVNKLKGMHMISLKKRKRLPDFMMEE